MDPSERYCILLLCALRNACRSGSVLGWTPQLSHSAQMSSLLLISIGSCLLDICSRISRTLVTSLQRTPDSFPLYPPQHVPICPSHHHDNLPCLHVLNDILSQGVILGSFLSVSMPTLTSPVPSAKSLARPTLGLPSSLWPSPWAKLFTSLIWDHFNQLLKPPHHQLIPHTQKTLFSKSQLGNATCLLIMNTAVVFCCSRITPRERRAAPPHPGLCSLGSLRPRRPPFLDQHEDIGVSPFRASACTCVC